MARQAINDNSLEQVVGGLMRFNYNTQILTYTREDGSVTTYNILDFDNAWERSNALHGKNVHEDRIIEDLINSGYIS